MGVGVGVRLRAATGGCRRRGRGADPRVIVGRPEGEEGEEGVGEAVEAVTEVESGPGVGGADGGVGGVEGYADRVLEVAEEGDGEEGEDDEDQEEHQHQVTQRRHRQQDLCRAIGRGWRGRGGVAGARPRKEGMQCLSPEQRCRGGCACGAAPHVCNVGPPCR